ncbi:beta-lactamase family protein [Pelagibacteraceae bacterium]|jgi:CubicO group peptidase (beta-lactamase class C family)|nr:beta-lactamase family protein [Pelagibacteraceae bacterium]
MIVSGICSNEFLEIKEILTNEITQGHSLGSAFAVFKNGKPLIDLYGGYTQIDTVKKWNKDSIVPVHSVGKGIVSLCLVLLISRGELDLDSYVSDYWPEFAKNNKSDIKIRTLFSHQAGLYGWKEKLYQSDFYNWDYCVNLLANQKTFHKPGDETCYHAKTIGFLAGEIIKRITKQTVGNFINKEFVKKRSLSCFIGTPKKYHSKISDTKSLKFENNQNQIDKKKDMYTNISFNNPISNRNIYKEKDWIESEIPSLNCYANASSLAQIYDLFVSKNKSSIVDITSINEVLNVESNRMDFVMRLPIKWSPVGFIIDGGRLFGRSSKSFGHTGSGGSVAFADIENGISVAYTTNTFSKSVMGDNRALNLVSKLYEII